MGLTRFDFSFPTFSKALSTAKCVSEVIKIFCFGFSVYDRPEIKKYKDQAEIDILKHLLKEREAFYLISISQGLNPKISLSKFGVDSITTGIKYQYINTQFIGYDVRKITGLDIHDISDSFGLRRQYRSFSSIHDQAFQSF